jgi:hypothetical protein
VSKPDAIAEVTGVTGVISSTWIEVPRAPDECQVNIELAEALDESSADGVKDRECPSLPELVEAVDIMAVLLTSLTGKVVAELLANGDEAGRKSDSPLIGPLDDPVNLAAAVRSR